MTGLRPRSAWLLVVAVLALVGGACSDGGDDGAARSGDRAASTVQADPEDFSPRPPLPANVNAIPYVLGDLAALGNVSLRVADITDDGAGEGEGEGEGDDAERDVEVEVEVTNGALEPVSFTADSFRLYVDTGASTEPDVGQAFDDPVPSGETVTVAMGFSVPGDAALLALVFDSATYGDRVTSGLLALDPAFVPAPADS